MLTDVYPSAIIVLGSFYQDV